MGDDIIVNPAQVNEVNPGWRKGIDPFSNVEQIPYFCISNAEIVAYLLFMIIITHDQYNEIFL